jgi:hypothetical protein
MLVYRVFVRMWRLECTAYAKSSRSHLHPRAAPLAADTEVRHARDGGRYAEHQVGLQQSGSSSAACRRELSLVSGPTSWRGRFRIIHQGGVARLAPPRLSAALTAAAVVYGARKTRHRPVQTHQRGREPRIGELRLLEKQAELLA